MKRRLFTILFSRPRLYSRQLLYGAFTTIINSPPDAIAPGSVFGVDAQINLHLGSIAEPFDMISLGAFNAPAQNVELNVLGGYAWSVQAWTGSQLNVSDGLVNAANLLGGRGVMSGGVVRNWVLFAEGRLEMSGGFANTISTAGAVDAPAPDDAYFKMTGGEVGLLDANGNAIIQGGSIDSMVFRGAGFIELTGGEIGDDFEVGGVVIGALPDDPLGETVIGSGGRLIVRGGSIGQRMVLYGGKTLDYFSGDIGDAFQALKGSRVNIRGSQFFLDGVELDVTAGEELVLARDVTLTGLLADGSSFEFDLHSQVGQGDYFSPGATVAVMLVPEPHAAATVGILFVALAVNSRWRRSGQA